MIKSFKCKHTEKLFVKRQQVKAFEGFAQAARETLALLDAAEKLEDLAWFPGLRLEKLKGRRKLQHSIRINGQYRVCFVWQKDGAHDVEIVDYHK